MKENKEEKTAVKKKAKKTRNKIIIYFVFLIIVAYFSYTVYLLIKQPTNKVTVEYGKLYSEETGIGYIIRDEQVVKGENYKNGMEQIKTEGQKTAKGESMYRYYSKNEEELNKQISELDEKIQEALEGQNDLFSSDIKLLEEQLDEIIEQLSDTTDISKITEYKKQVNNLISKKSKIAGEASPSGSYLKQLYTQRTALENQLNSGAEYIQAPQSGIVSYKVDGLEETLTPDNFSAISKEFLEGLNLKTGQLIATSDESGKIINNFKCYIATISSTEEAKNAEVGDDVQIRLSNNKTIDAEISYIIEESEEERILILEINRQIEELTNYRKISFDLIWWSATGLKVPNSAIVTENDLNYVVRSRAGYLTKVLINVKKQNNKYSIIKNYTAEELEQLNISRSEGNLNTKISLYDEVIVNPDMDKLE